MKLYKVTITPTSNFATKLKGDTLLGQLSWAIFYKLGKKKLDLLLKNYVSDMPPFLVVSDAFPKGYLPKPKMPSESLDEKREDKKRNRKKIWLTPKELKEGQYTKARTDKDIDNRDSIGMIMHNALNYQTSHTGDGFDPYGVEEFVLSQKDIYLLHDPKQLSLDELKDIFRLISEMGYGKNITVGKGRFDYGAFQEIDMNTQSKTFMTLSPIALEASKYKEVYYEPFTRFGKFGASRAYKNAFKKPILLADTATVLIFDEPKEHGYLGRAINNLSDIPEYRDTIHQGYSIVVPIGVTNE